MDLKRKTWIKAFAAISILFLPTLLQAAVTKCGLSGDGTSDRCCNNTGQCLSGFGALNQNAVGQSNDLLVGEGILFQGTGWKPGIPIEIFWDPSKIGTCTPPSGGSFNNAGTTANNTTCKNLACTDPPCPGIVPTDPSANGFGFTVPNFDVVDGPCSSYVRAVQGSVEIDAELVGIPMGVVIFSLLGPGQTSIISGGGSPAPGDSTCQTASAKLVPSVTPGSALVESNGQGETVAANDDKVSTLNIGIASGHNLFLGVGDRTVEVAVPAGPNPSNFKPATCSEIRSPSGTISISGQNCSKGDLIVDGDITMNNANLYVPGRLTVNGAVGGTGAIIATGKMAVAGSAQLLTDDVFSFVSGGDMYLCGGTPGCGPVRGSPTPTAKRTPTASAKGPTHTPTRTPSKAPTHTATRTPAHTSTKTPIHTATRTPARTPTKAPVKIPTPTAT